MLAVPGKQALDCVRLDVGQQQLQLTVLAQQGVDTVRDRAGRVKDAAHGRQNHGPGTGVVSRHKEVE